MRSFTILAVAVWATWTPTTAAAQGSSRAYFQQQANYRIEAVLDETQPVLHGQGRLQYVNQSPDTLRSLYLHLYLNAFRPNSAWARREMEYGVRRFQDLGPDEWGFDHLLDLMVDNTTVTPVYPGEPDSTVVAFVLPTPLAPGGTVTVDMKWDSRPSTIPRRQGRRGRQYDFAQWYPKVAVYDARGWEPHALMPQGEFYGEFGDFDVTMDLASDQVMAATGVPVQGDPGWEGSSAPGSEPPQYQRDFYADRPTASLGLLSSPVEPGRKRVHWRAEKVHNFVWTTSPDFVYEGGQWNGTSVHVLRHPDDADWAGTAVRNTVTTLQWLAQIFGPFVWPQITNIHRLDGGGTEFPMMIMDANPSLGLILHELGHNYTMGYMANNEWREGFLDEGLTSFQTAWYSQTHGQPQVWPPTFEAVATSERSKQCSQPIATESADFSDPACYSVMTYSKPSVVYRMLQAYLGEDVLRQGLQTYYRDNRFQHVTLEDFQRAMEKASGQNLSWFFDQWFRSIAQLDYAIHSAETEQQGDGTWRTRLQVVRHGAAWMPVTLQVGGERMVLRSRAPLQSVVIVSKQRPAEALLDPDGLILDLNRANDHWRF